jgi:hypothetical protein
MFRVLRPFGIALSCVLIFLSIPGKTFAQVPTITAITPPSGVAGTQITITGQSLLPGLSRSLMIGGQEVVATSWTDTQIAATIPFGLPGNTTLNCGIDPIRSGDAVDPVYAGFEDDGLAAPGPARVLVTKENHWGGNRGTNSLSELSKCQAWHTI